MEGILVGLFLHGQLNVARLDLPIERSPVPDPKLGLARVLAGRNDGLQDLLDVDRDRFPEVPALHLKAVEFHLAEPSQLLGLDPVLAVRLGVPDRHVGLVGPLVGVEGDLGGYATQQPDYRCPSLGAGRDHGHQIVDPRSHVGTGLYERQCAHQVLLE